MSNIGSLRKQIEKLGQQMEQSKRGPLMAANFEGLPEAHRATLRAAAKGDAAALAKAQPYPVSDKSTS